MMLAVVPNPFVADDPQRCDTSKPASGVSGFVSAAKLYMTMTSAYDGRDRRVFAVIAILAARNRVLSPPISRSITILPAASVGHRHLDQGTCTNPGSRLSLALNAERYLKDERRDAAPLPRLSLTRSKTPRNSSPG